MKTALLPLLALSAALLQTASAQITDPRLPISLDAEATDYDGRNSMLRFTGLRLSQGSIGIQADEGSSSKLDFADSVWQFSGNVIIDIENGHIESEQADLKFSDHQLKIATITGNPATFELRRENGEAIYAEAGNLAYDLSAGTIEFSGNARITEGGNQIAAEMLVYNIREQRYNAKGSSNESGRVRITYTPSDSNGDDTDSEAAEGDEQHP